MSRSFKQQAASQRIKLKRIKAELTDMGAQWEDYDNYFVELFNSLADQCDLALKHLDPENVMDGEL